MKFFYLNKSQGYVVATLLCLVFLGICYFFLYLPANEKSVEEQRFRTLQNIDRNIHAKIDNSLSLVNNLLEAYKSQSKDIDRYISKYSQDKFILSPVTRLPANKAVRDSLDSLPNLIVNDVTRQIKLLSTKLVATPKDTSVLQGSVQFSFKQFIVHLLPDAVFDDYIVFSKGNTVFESFPTGISNAREDSLLNLKNGVGGSYAKDITIGGKDYKLFLQPVAFDSNNKWLLGGLLSKSRYQKERTQLPAAIIMLMVTAVLVMIVIFPWIKLYQMGSKDRVTLADGASSIAVSMLLMSLLFFCFFKYNAGVRSNGSPDSKKILAEKMKKAFYDETTRMYRILQTYDSLRYENKMEQDIVNLQKPTIAFVPRNADTKKQKNDDNVIDSGVKSVISRFDNAAKINQVFWLDSTGCEVLNWTAQIQNAPHGNFKSRNYFRNITEDKTYYLNGNDTQKYYLDQVISWVSGVFTSVLSIPVKNQANHVAAISFNIRSVQDAILPTGYSFAIIDNKGKVLYHSQKSRNLNENIKSELSDSANISSCIDARAEGEFTARYYSKSYAVRITPLKDLPYFIIIFSDAGYKEMRDIEIYSFTFSMLLLFFLYIVLQLCITFLVSSRRSFFKKQLFDTSWIGPRISSHKVYILSAAVNTLIIILLIACFQKMSFLQYLFLLLFAVTFISLFLNAMLAKQYRKGEKKNNYKYKRIAVWWLSGLLIIINLTAFNLLQTGNFFILFITEAVAIAAGWILIEHAERVPANIRDALSAKWNYTHSFSLMVLTGLIITSGIPVAFFYITSYNYEQNLGIRHRQTDYGNTLLEQRKLNLSGENKYITDDSTGIYWDKAWISAFPELASYSEINKTINDSGENEKARKILGTFRLSIGEKAVKTNKLYLPYAADTSVIYQPLLINTDTGSSVSTYVQTGVAGKYIKLSSFKLNYIVPVFFNGKGAFLYWLLLAAALLIFYIIINNIVKKLFCLNLPDFKIWKELDDKILTDNSLNKRLFIIGLPGAGKLNYIMKKIKDKKMTYDEEPLVCDCDNAVNNNVFVADLINIPDAGAEIEKDKDWIKFTKKILQPEHKLIIINHFEYNIQDEYTNLAKLNLLEQLMLKSKSKVIILSAIHPVTFLDSINDLGKKTGSTAKLSHDLERWNVLLGHYRISIIPITKKEVTPDSSWKALIRTETNYTHFLQEMQQCTLDIASTLQEQEAIGKTDELAYKLQVSAHYFYMYIWQSLTKEEKFLLYDLAEDNLVNSYDDYNLTMLIAKGVIIHSNGSLRFFNKGFRNFILTAIGNTEAMKIKNRIKENGNWSNLKMPLIIVILAILSFLLISQQEAYARLLTYAAALSAGIPAVLKIFSLFDKNVSKIGV